MVLLCNCWSRVGAGVVVVVRGFILMLFNRRSRCFSAVLFFVGRRRLLFMVCVGIVSVHGVIGSGASVLGGLIFFFHLPPESRNRKRTNEH